MPASTTAKANPTKLQVADALEKAKAKVTEEFTGSSYKEVVELACKLITKYTREELKL